MNNRARLLLFRYKWRGGQPGKDSFWGTPGGAVQTGETYEAAARREMLEELGIPLSDPGPQVMKSIVRFALASGEPVVADERYFLIHLDNPDLCFKRWTPSESESILDVRWWSLNEIRGTSEKIWPEKLVPLLVELGMEEQETGGVISPDDV